MGKSYQVIWGGHMVGSAQLQIEPESKFLTDKVKYSHLVNVWSPA